jgi:radical SAM superfamily enzyme YgiQ (UPF0313 family)
MRVFLADLGHNQLTLSSDVYPLGIANLAAYVQAHLQAREPVEIQLFREPQHLRDALDQGPPDVLGLSSYSWNHYLSLQFARYAKACRSDTLTLMGGPNYPLTAGEQETFVRGMPEIDVAVRGPTYEGERATLNLLRRYLETGRSLEGLQQEPVPGSHWINRRTGAFVRGADVERIRDLDEIPSPYLAGWMEPFYATGYFPLLQIARGCPFSCTFCNSSVAANSRIYAHSVDNVKADLLYIAQRVRSELPVCFADDNFGMYPRDEEVADYIGYLQSRYNWPNYIRTTTGKNQAERIIRVMRKVRGSLPMTSAVQSLNPEVLSNIKRSNISLDAYAAIQKEVQAQGMQSYGELILCLPGETKASILKAVDDLLEAGVKRVSAHQLMLLHGAPLSNPDSRERFGFQTRFRVVARNLGNYTGEPVIEVEEMVVETATFSFADYLDTRVFHLLLTIFYYEGNFEEAFELARQNGLKPFDLIVRLQALLPQAPRAFQELIRDFLQESQEELYATREACLEWAQAHFEDLATGKLGGNLLSKYSMLGRFYRTQEALDLLDKAIGSWLEEAGKKESADLLWTVMSYLRGVLLHVPFARTLEETPHWTAWFDVEAWRGDGYQKALADYLFAYPRTLTTAVDPARKALLEQRLATFGEHPAGLGKFTRTLFAQDLRRSVVAIADGTPLHSEVTHDCKV